MSVYWLHVAPRKKRRTASKIFYSFFFMPSSRRSHTYKALLQRGRSATPKRGLSQYRSHLLPNNKFPSRSLFGFLFFILSVHIITIYLLLRQQDAKLQDTRATNFLADVYKKFTRWLLVYYLSANYIKLQFKCIYIICLYYVYYRGIVTFSLPRNFSTFYDYLHYFIIFLYILL